MGKHRAEQHRRPGKTRRVLVIVPLLILIAALLGYGYLTLSASPATPTNTAATQRALAAAHTVKAVISDSVSAANDLASYPQAHAAADQTEVLTDATTHLASALTSLKNPSLRGVVPSQTLATTSLLVTQLNGDIAHILTCLATTKTSKTRKAPSVCDGAQASSENVTLARETGAALAGLLPYASVNTE